MKSAKKAVLEELMGNFLEDQIVGDGEDGYMGKELHIHMANAAKAVYDSHMEKERFLKEEGIMSRA